MKIIKEQFDSYAQDLGYEDGAELLDELGYSTYKYIHSKKEVPVGGKIFKALCINMGSSEVLDFMILSPIERERYKEIIEEY